MIAAGMDCTRINMSHGAIEDALVLPGRGRAAGGVGKGPVLREAGWTLRLTPGNSNSTDEVIHVTYADRRRDVLGGDRLPFADGATDCEIVDRTGDSMIGRVVHGGR